MLSKISSEFDGQTRRLFPINCVVCGTEFWIPKHRYKRSKFCSLSCSGRYMRRRITRSCAFCSKTLLIKASRKRDWNFCNRLCKEKAQKFGGLLHVRGDGKTSYRSRYLQELKLLGKPAACGSCGYSELEKMIDVDHIDGDRRNNGLDNLQLLCVWCHALKTRIG